MTVGIAADESLLQTRRGILQASTTNGPRAAATSASTSSPAADSPSSPTPHRPRRCPRPTTSRRSAP